MTTSKPTCTCGKAHDKTKTPCLCPFCGGEAKEGMDWITGSGGPYPDIRCDYCDIQARPKTSDGKEECLRRWNHRTPDARLEAYKTFIEEELAGMRKLVAEQEHDPVLAPFAQVLKGKIARYRTMLET